LVSVFACNSTDLLEFLQQGGSVAVGNDGKGGMWAVADVRDPDFGKAFTDENALRGGVLHPETDTPFHLPLHPGIWTHNPKAESRM
jgi:hypothetical protein